ncbi:autotransporter outer membrane beta-barrel domain-containing protein [Bartonella henselae]|uniref:autotransporter outer membrane beta-barrel domain-containing protein n=3 Tax=Bartonella henselae TaxID=38323 RepID=UPI001F28A262|nr:autotransporter outer membrane beta-barrel domain-containing protein [Bartonella henselae]UJM33498.1 autotransporter outer membrane beta-barrel domain-containing protein [Bartonella henselae]
MCKKSNKKNFLLCTIAGTLIFSHFGSTHAKTLLHHEIPTVRTTNGEEKKLNNVFIHTGSSGVHATKKAVATVTKETIHEIPEIQVTDGKEKAFDNVFIRTGSSGVYATKKAVATVTKATIHANSFALAVSTGGRVNAKEIEANVLQGGLSITNGIINVQDSIIEAKKESGIIFHKILDFFVKEGEEVVNKAILNNTKLLVRDGVGIVGPLSSKSVAEVQLRNSEIRSDVLLKNHLKKATDSDPHPVTLILTADNSIMEGRARTLQVNTTVFNLSNNSKWYLNVSQYDVDRDSSVFNYALHDIKQRAFSTVSVLNLHNSSIVFNAPHALANGHYQTLSVGKVQTAEDSRLQENRDSSLATVYNATGNAKIYFNTEWSDGLPKEKQKADRLLIHGNVSGTTTIHINNLSKNEETKEASAVPLNTRGVSFVQVFGKAEENSFKLANGYTTMGGLPYKYMLNAYGPTSNRGKANAEQSRLGEVSQESKENAPVTNTNHLVLGGVVVEIEQDIKGEPTSNRGKANAEKSLGGENKNFWDFRLQSATLDDEGEIRALVPQVASYLVMPNALFSTGLAELNNQNILLENMRTTLFEAKDKKEDNKKSGIFLSSYGHKITLSSNRSPLHYGYGADVHYTAIQAGMTLAALEGQNSTTHFGLLGTYGKLSFTPKGMEGADKSTLDKWSLAAYGNIQHNDGIYVNALFSYGAFKGNITTALIGNTAKLDGSHTVSASATIGHKLETDAKGLVFEPQAQLLYQRLMLGTLSDVDGFNVNMGKPHQWLLRIGGRLTQTIPSDEKGYATSFYGKLNLMKAFSNKSTIQIGDTFYLDAMGDSVEGGLGVNAQLSQNFALHADINYQYKLQKAGVSGINFSAGMRYQF